MNGSIRIMAAKTARILGTKISVCSWICVSACKSETTKPTIRATSMSGAPTLRNVTMPSRAMSRMAAPVMAAPSDRHAHDFLIRRDDTVTHGDEGLEGRLAFGDGGDHVDDIGLAARRRHRLRLGGFAGLGDAVHGALQERGEVEAGAGRRGAGFRGPAQESLRRGIGAGRDGVGGHRSAPLWARSRCVLIDSIKTHKRDRF